MTPSTANTLEVTGARLYYEVAGSGPVLMLIGLPMDHTGFAPIVPHLADRYTVVTYDPRGFLNSPVDDPGEPLTPELVADDVHRVLAEVTDGPADVLGSSGGAVTGLALVAAHPEQVRVLVAHEPPIYAFLPDAEQQREKIRDTYETFQREGLSAAWGKFFAHIFGDGGAPIDPATAFGEEPPTPEMIASSERLFSNSMLPTTAYHPDPARLGRPAGQVVIGAGVASAGQYANRTAVALAEHAGLRLVQFPGDHGGFMGEAEPFAAKLVEVLGEGR